MSFRSSRQEAFSGLRIEVLPDFRLPIDIQWTATTGRHTQLDPPYSLRGVCVHDLMRILSPLRNGGVQGMVVGQLKGASSRDATRSLHDSPREGSRVIVIPLIATGSLFRVAHRGPAGFSSAH